MIQFSPGPALRAAGPAVAAALPAGMPGRWPARRARLDDTPEAGAVRSTVTTAYPPGH